METVWQPSRGEARQGDEYVFAGDIGGTNTGFALVRLAGGKLFTDGKFLFQTRAVPSLAQAAREAIGEIRRKLPGIVMRKACLCVAGPVAENRCVMTNVPWTISGEDLGAELGMRVKIINDFTALGYALPLLDLHNPEEITPLCRGGGAPSPSGKIRAVVGAGTGLGIGCLAETGGGFTAIASEGGHTDFAATDPLSRELRAWVEKRIGSIPETELFVSGQGLINLFGFFREKAEGTGRLSEAFSEIAALPDGEKPARIAARAARDPGCADIMRLFVRMYARVAYNAAVTFLPTAGLYLAGGIVGKTEAWFLEDGAFMKGFLAAYRPKIRDLLKSIPVYIIRDYGASLRGAGNAARCLMGGE
ncbi:MAG: glucokinase [Spirochaetia bacterium]|jgi:glucokinase|nr:glucokinase [Spirochaetia bacterium]